MSTSVIARRLVFHIGGYDPVTPHDTAYARFSRELRRFERTWSVQCSVSPIHASDNEANWSVVADGPNWRVHSDYHLVRWDDVIAAFGRQPLWRRVPNGIVAFLDFVGRGALWGYFRTNWHYALFFLYPFLVSIAFISAASIAGAVGGAASDSIVVGACLAVGAVALFFLGPWRWLHLAPLFDDWIFSRAYIRSENAVLRQRLDRIARDIVEASRQSSVDEILIVGHSLGAVLAIDLLDRALALDRSLGTTGPRVSLVSIGSSVLKIGLHRGADRFRAAVQRVADAPGIFWGDYQARIDIMNFYDTDPMREMALESAGKPVVRLVEISRMLERAVYRRIRLRFFRVHCQFISGNDRRAAYDYFMLVCGPRSAQCQTVAPDGAIRMFGDNGALNEALGQEASPRESQ